MKKIAAIINPFKVDEVKQALCELGITGLTATEVRGCGRQKGLGVERPGWEYMSELLPKMKVEVVAPDHLVGSVLEVIQRVARTGHIGDGKLFVASVEEGVRIRTGERGDGAL